MEISSIIWDIIDIKFFSGRKFKDISRVYVTIKHAYWYYCDVLVKAYKDLKALKFSEFLFYLKENCFSLNSLQDKLTEQNINNYDVKINRYGCILINSRNEVLMVKDTKKFWGFPGGKLNSAETEIQCAARETLEETRYDASAQIISNIYVEDMDRIKSRYYVVFDVPLKFEFGCDIKEEIVDHRWIFLYSEEY